MSFRVRFSALLGAVVAVSSLPVVLAVPAAHAAATPPFIVALTGPATIMSFPSTTPGTVGSPVSVTGLQAGDTLVDLEFRALTNQLLGIGQNFLYTVNVQNGAATTLGATYSPALAGGAYGAALIPTADELRVVSDADQNLRVNTATGAVLGAETPLAYAAADANFGDDPSVVALAYTNDFAGATSATAYGIDSANDILVRLGSVNGSPTPASSGQLSTVGSLGVDTSTLTELDINAPTNTAYAVLTPPSGTVSTLYTVNLTTGLASPVGAIAGGATVRAIAAVPPFQVKMAATAISVGEAAGTVTVNVTRTGNNEGAVTVQYATSNGTAEAGQDYTTTNGTLNFPDVAGVNTQSFTVPITNDTFIDGPETFTVTLSNPGGGISLAEPTSSTVTINDDETGMIFGLTNENKIAQVSTNAPSILIAAVAVTGLQSGETLVAIDFRPSSSQLLGVGTTGRLYEVNPVTGAATQIGSPFTLPAGVDFGADVNPVADALRLVSDAEANVRINPTTAAATPDTALVYAAADPAFGTNPNVSGLGYTNNLAGAVTTTAYGIDSGTDTLVRLGSVDGSPTSPNTGQLFTVGALGVDSSDLAGIDIVGGGGAAFAALTSNSPTSPSRVYRVNLTTGATVHLGLFGGNHPVRSIAVAPPGKFNLSAASYTVSEIAGSITVTVNRTLGAPVTEAVSYAVTPGTATASADYTAVSGTLTFNGGETSKTVSVPILDDAVDEPNETFTFTLSSPTNGTTIGTAAATVTINDNDLTTLYASTSTNRLISIRTDSLAAAQTDVAITGMAGGETVVGLDSRPSNRTLYALGSTGQLYTLNVTNGVATAVGSATALAGTAFGADVDPVAGNLRVVSDTDANGVRDLGTGAATAGTALAYPASGDPSSGVNPNVVGIGYTNNVPGATSATLYGIDFGTDKLVRIGSVNGSPTGAGAGVLTTIGALGTDTSALSQLDIDPHGDLAFAALTAPAGTSSQLYRVDLSFGPASLIGTIPGGSTITGLAVAPLATLTVVPGSATPVSGAATTATVTAKGANGQTDTAYVAKPVLTSTDTHFNGGTCTNAVDGVSTCTGVVFGDLGAKILTATAAGATGNATVTTQPSGLAFTTAPASTPKNTPTTYITAPVAGVSGASLAGYTSNQTLTVSGGTATPQTQTQPCAGPTCSFTVTYPDGGPRTVTASDTSTPSRSATANTSVQLGSVLTLRVTKIIASGEKAEPFGRLLGEGGAPLPAGTRVNIYQRFIDKPNFNLIGYVPTLADGSFTVPGQFPRYSTIYRAEFTGLPTNAPSEAFAGQAVRARIRVDHASFLNGVLHFDGYVFPGKPGAQVGLFLQQPNGTFKWFGPTVTLSSTSGFNINRRLSRGRYRIRIQISDTRANLGGFSVTFPLNV